MNQKLNLHGALSALVTPFSANGENLDIDAFEALLTAQLESGIDGLVPCGTTGESPTLTDQEKRDIIAHTVRLAKGRVPIVAGTGSNDTQMSLRASQTALDLGADAIMLVMPYYNKPSQEGLFQHITTIATQIGNAPVVLYNIPGRSVVDLSNDTLARIVDAAPNVVAVKDATGNVLRCQQVMHRFGNAITVLCGDDALTPAMMTNGALGVISVTSNLYPDRVSAVCRAMKDSNIALARRLHLALLPVHDAMFVEPNPVPIKAALASKKRMHPTVRLPLSPASRTTQDLVSRVTAAYEATEVA